MVVEKYIKTPVRTIQTLCQKLHYVDGRQVYRILSQEAVFTVVGEYWYDGVKFYVGSYCGAYAERLVEATTFMNGSVPLSGRSTPQKLIEQFKANLLKANKTIQEVIRDARLRNLDLEAWQNFLIM